MLVGAMRPPGRYHETLWNRAIVILRALSALVGLGLLAAPTIEAKHNRKPTYIADANNRLAVEVFQRVSGKPGNIFFSPPSLLLALCVLREGTAGETQRELDNLLGFKLNDEKVRSAYKSYREALLSFGRNQSRHFGLAASLWVSHRFRLLASYRSHLVRVLGAESSTVDFRLSSTAAAINQWVTRQTQGRVKPTRRRFPVETAAIVAATSFFSGRWAYQFNRRATKRAIFHVPKLTAKRVPMMDQEEELYYLKTDRTKVLSLPYQGPGLSMVVVLPDDRFGLPQIERSLNADQFREWTGRLSVRTVRAFVPRFAIEWQAEMNGILEQLGISRLMSMKAEIPSIVGAQPAFASSVEHQAFVSVDEYGTVAASATGGMIVLGDPPRRAVFRANHPFLFFIWCHKTGSVLFLGRVVDPSL